IEVGTLPAPEGCEALVLPTPAKDVRVRKPKGPSRGGGGGGGGRSRGGQGHGGGKGGQNRGPRSGGKRPGKNQRHGNRAKASA
ncbi:MAG: hypothetical protein AAFW65_08575, partial [Pseudomonadota bacterium]